MTLSWQASCMMRFCLEHTLRHVKANWELSTCMHLFFSKMLAGLKCWATVTTVFHGDIFRNYNQQKTAITHGSFAVTEKDTLYVLWFLLIQHL